MNFLSLLIKKIWNCFWYPFGKVRYFIWMDEDKYIASASNGDITVDNCYGNTPEMAKERAYLKLKQTLKDNERELMAKGNGFKLYRIK